MLWKKQPTTVVIQCCSLETVVFCVQSTPPHEVKASDSVETTAADDAIDNNKDEENSPADESPSVPADEDCPDDAMVTAATAEEPAGQRVTADMIERLSALIAESWDKLATTLKFQQDDIIYFQTDNSTGQAQAAKMLTVWTVSSLCHCLVLGFVAYNAVPYYAHFPCFSESKTYHCLPAAVCEADSLYSFQCKLKTRLFTLCFNDLLSVFTNCVMHSQSTAE